ncbi:hypothetical protein FB45DRAFT_1126552 [Roridomyces roridus]|uniref:MYND-type domain-containing protein n=1 Tax=Roridomyces roridus TaxID=1738132 RepID=A0AAD7C8Y8_9AGAR|nr:hypothetical protein FB45DRAFT_1126552 [Roridomyces roridus]
MPPPTRDPGSKPEHRRPPCPDRHSDKVGWNDWLETELALNYDSFKYSGKRIEDLATPLWNDHSIEFQNLDIAQRTKELMRSEGALIDLALENIRFGTFEKDWGALSVERKRELALEGLYRGSCACPASEDVRILCPELRIDGLVGDGEYNVMNLLERLMAHSPTRTSHINTVFLFEHPYISHRFRHSPAAPDLLKAWVRANMLYRNLCIVLTLSGILQAFNGRSFIPSTFVKQQPKEHHDKQHKPGKNCCNAHREAANAPKVYACTKCFKEMERNKLKLCGGCKLTFYCGSECQKKDWAEHKKVCGKTDFDPEAAQPHPENGPVEFIGCPPLSDGYTRTPALWRQIQYLSETDSQDRVYHFDTGPNRTVSIDLPPGIRDIFLVARRRAMGSGSIPAIHTMFKMVTETETRVIWGRPSVEQIRKQFEREYRVEITEETIRGAEPFASPTQRELKEEWEFYQRRLESVNMGLEG